MSQIDYPIGDIMNGAKLRIRHSLPEISFKRGNVKYTTTDFRYLRVDAVEVFKEILAECASKPNVDEVEFNINDTSSDELEIIIEILTGVVCKARKRGKKAYKLEGCFLVSGCSYNDERATFHVIKEHANVIYKLAAGSTDGQPLMLSDIVVAICDDSIISFEAAGLMERQEKHV